MSADHDIAPGPWPTGRVGYVALLGRPNAGKSTLLNTILDMHLAPVSRQPQTTRRRLLGIVSDAEAQLLFLDAPGVHAPRHALDEAMFAAIRTTLADADVVLCVIDPTRPPGDEDSMVATHAAETGKPVLLALNKGDLATAAQRQASAEHYRQALPEAPVLTTVATSRETLLPLLDQLKRLLPTGPFLYPVDAVTTAPEREIGAELIRETLLETLRDEVPHTMAVTIEDWKESDRGVRITATLHVEREQQKHIVIGRNGFMIKKIRNDARRKLEALCDGRVTLELWVKASPGWRQHHGRLREFDLA